MKTKKFLLLDADTIAYRSAALYQYNYAVYSLETGNFLENVVSKKHFLDKIPSNVTADNFEFRNIASVVEMPDGSDPKYAAFHAAKEQLVKYTEKQPWVEDYKILLHKRGNFRDEIATIWPYKGNRGPKPILTDAVKDYIGERFGEKVEFAYDEEADDLCGIYAWKEGKKSKWNSDKHNLVVGGIDKDLKQIPGWHWNYDRDVFEWVGFNQAAYNFWKQVLQGDGTDNIPGVQKLPDEAFQKYSIKKARNGGVGEKTAENFLAVGKTNKEWAAICADLYKMEYGEKWWNVMEENCRLLYLRRKKREIFSLKKCLDNAGVSYE